MSLYKYYEISNLIYLIYTFFVRIIFISIISIITYYLYHTDNKILKVILSLIIGFNLLDIYVLPITMNTILSGYQFKSFSMEIISTLIMISVYIIFLLIIKKLIINKKRDIG